MIGVQELVQIINGQYLGKSDIDIDGVASLNRADEHKISFLSNKKYTKYISTTRAGCIIVDQAFDISAYNYKNFVVCKDAYLGFALALSYFYKNQLKSNFKSHKASIDKTAQISEEAYIGDFTYIAENVKIGHSSIMPMVYIGENTIIKDNCIIYPNVTIRENVEIGNNVIIHSGSVIGSDGFGYVNNNGKHYKIPQVGKVIIEDDVEIGSNTSIDRATLDETIIKKGSKIDNLVQIAHNVEIGENSILVSQCGISGSTKIGNNVILAGQVGIAGHLKIADNTIITAKSGVGTNIKKSGIYSGIPVYDHAKWLKSSATMPRLPELYRKIQELENRIKELEKK
ncbi:UDP-3-O-[3-hydroxymyristoyl] glucosamine N-acyltransferase [Desulfurella amilsii]|uniref:UDP-3-O-acylglucosamine N-acyltransferase n=1 Tax=Desulfurella amilsii TaxID=1562698 RepID=A0A1X4XVM3_9BACT|nr:UDP-3-O-(3-hydroxymyristoyl)glucosamine N-acyltransferase [Desulfurella amilsii]OSS41596.1 UDP-3-O-[3-hydroxymyristoyl] glucosamine N-acyltransferase [Desulfurella amilsii]